jgi:short subunit dehydrogenase-like uncharacterized protein
MAVVLYGATGYTGRLVAAELSARGMPVVLGGRDAQKLRSVSEEVGGAPWRVATIGDPSAVEALLAGSSVLINCAGPFAQTGEPIVRAAIAARAHYIDSTGEQAYMQRILTTQDAPARAAEVAVVPAMGFDFVPGDCIAALIAAQIGELDTLTIGYDVANWGMSRGTMHTALEVMRGGGGLRHRDGKTVRARAGARSLVIDFGPDTGKARCVTYPSGEVLTVPRHTDVRNVECYMSSRSVAPPALAPIFPLLRPVLAGGLRTPLRRALDAAIRRLSEGPDPEARAEARFTLVADAQGRNGQTRRGLVTGRDTYGLSATLLAWAAERMSSPSYPARGALAPSQAFEPEAALAAIGKHEVRWQID